MGNAMKSSKKNEKKGKRGKGKSNESEEQQELICCSPEESSICVFDFTNQ